MDEVIEKALLLSAVADPKSVDPLYSFTVLPASAVPVIAGVLSLVVVAVVVKYVGALGAVVSMVIDKVEEEDEVLPAGSVAVAVNE